MIYHSSLFNYPDLINYLNVYYKTRKDSVLDRLDRELEIVKSTERDKIPPIGSTMNLSVAPVPFPIIVNPS